MTFHRTQLQKTPMAIINEQAMANGIFFLVSHSFSFMRVSLREIRHLRVEISSIMRNSRLLDCL